jgi:hypothetical protein
MAFADIDRGEEAHDAQLEGVEVDFDVGHVDRPAVGGVGVAGIARVVQVSPGGEA